MSTAQVEPNDQASAGDDQWTVAQLTKNGQPLFARYRNQRPNNVAPAAFPFLLSATWAFEPNEFGLPSAVEMQLMDKFEEALDSALESSNTAYLMVVLTGGGERDWLWYTSSEEEAM